MPCLSPYFGTFTGVCSRYIGLGGQYYCVPDSVDYIIKGQGIWESGQRIKSLKLNRIFFKFRFECFEPVSGEPWVSAILEKIFTFRMNWKKSAYPWMGND
jgi:hypothetical protein